MLIREALAHGRGKLDPLDARLLLQQVLGVNYAYLLAHDDQRLTPTQIETYLAWVVRAARHEPVPHIIGTAPFYGRDFVVSTAVLIPRPETEQLVALALERLSQRAPSAVPWRILDVGTGSGCIPITLALETTHPTVITAVDISAEALAVAQENARRLGANVHFVCGNLLTAVGGTFDLITANLPYVTDAEWTTLDDGVKSYEPALALRGGADGLVLIKNLLDQAPAHLHSKSYCLLEIGWRQGNPAVELARHAFPEAAVHLHRDFAGHDRLVEIEIDQLSTNRNQ